MRKIRAWFEVQQLYMPYATVVRDRLAASDSFTDEPELINLFLPSAIRTTVACVDSLRRYEFEHREAQANDALNEIRDRLRLRTHLYKFKDRFIRGQRPNTRSRSEINRLSQKIDMSAKKYEVAYEALVRLAPILDETEWNTYLKPLDRDHDIRALDEAGYDQSEGKRRLSWIWLAPGVILDANGEEGDEHVHDGKFRA